MLSQEPYYSTGLHLNRKQVTNRAVPREIIGASDAEFSASRPTNLFSRLSTYLAVCANCGIDSTRAVVVAFDALESKLAGLPAAGFDTINAAIDRLITNGHLTERPETDDQTELEMTTRAFYHAYMRRYTSPWGFAIWQLYEGLFSTDRDDHLSTFESYIAMPLAVRLAEIERINVPSFITGVRSVKEQPLSQVYARFAYYVYLRAEKALGPNHDLNTNAAFKRSRHYCTQSGYAADGRSTRRVVWHDDVRLCSFEHQDGDLIGFKWERNSTAYEEIHVLWEMMHRDIRNIPSSLQDRFTSQSLRRVGLSSREGTTLPRTSVMVMPDRCPN